MRVASFLKFSTSVIAHQNIIGKPYQLVEKPGNHISSGKASYTLTYFNNKSRNFMAQCLRVYTQLPIPVVQFPTAKPAGCHFDKDLPFTCFDINYLSLIHISEPTRRTPISYAVF